MVPMIQLWLPILLSTVAVFLVSSLIHMVFKWHNADYRALPNEAEVAAAIRKGAPAPGMYVLPHCLEHKDMEKPEVAAKFAEGPVGMLYLKAPGMPKMGPALLGWLLFNGVLAFFLAYVAAHTLGVGTRYLQVFRVVGTVGFLAYAGSAVQGSIWMGKPWITTFKEMLDGLIYACVMAGFFGWLWPR
jgi:hypothetical protein